MNLGQSLLIFLESKDKSITTPEGFCPNRWGKEEYGGNFYKQIRQENLNVNSKESNVGWVNTYTNKYLEGIALKRKGNGEELICENCKISYQHTDEHTS